VDERRRVSDRWHIMELAIPFGAFFLLAIGFIFVWAISETAQEQGRLRQEHGHLMQKIVDACRRPLQ
jgi:hypothetical protein